MRAWERSLCRFCGANCVLVLTSRGGCGSGRGSRGGSRYAHCRCHGGGLHARAYANARHEFAFTERKISHILGFGVDTLRAAYSLVHMPGCLRAVVCFTCFHEHRSLAEVFAVAEVVAPDVICLDHCLELSLGVGPSEVCVANQTRRLAHIVAVFALGSNDPFSRACGGA